MISFCCFIQVYLTDKRERGDDELNAIDELKLTADVLVIGGGTLCTLIMRTDGHRGRLIRARLQMKCSTLCWRRHDGFRPRATDSHGDLLWPERRRSGDVSHPLSGLRIASGAIMRLS